MSNDSVLKKEFKQNDVQRLRNLVQGKYGDRTTMGTGYSKAKEFHDEGDIWEEDGRNWTIKNGVKQNITKLDKAKEGIVLPLFCPTCARSKIFKLSAGYWRATWAKNAPVPPPISSSVSAPFNGTIFNVSAATNACDCSIKCEYSSVTDCGAAPVAPNT